MSELAIEERSGVMTLSTTEIKRLSRRLPIRLRDFPETRGYWRETGRRCDCSYCLSRSGAGVKKPIFEEDHVKPG